jgi:hypothetical protein
MDRSGAAAGEVSRERPQSLSTGPLRFKSLFFSPLRRSIDPNRINGDPKWINNDPKRTMNDSNRINDDSKRINVDPNRIIDASKCIIDDTKSINGDAPSSPDDPLRPIICKTSGDGPSKMMDNTPLGVLS